MMTILIDNLYHVCIISRLFLVIIIISYNKARKKNKRCYFMESFLHTIEKDSQTITLNQKNPCDIIKLTFGVFPARRQQQQQQILRQQWLVGHVTEGSQVRGSPGEGAYGLQEAPAPSRRQPAVERDQADARTHHDDLSDQPQVSDLTQTRRTPLSPSVSERVPSAKPRGKHDILSVSLHRRKRVLPGSRWGSSDQAKCLIALSTLLPWGRWCQATVHNETRVKRMIVNFMWLWA